MRKTMKKSILAVILLVALILEGCSRAEKNPDLEISGEVMPGIYMSNNPADFPLPTSGYTVYFVGETHGNQQTKAVFQTYLQNLYKKAGLRDVILEEDQAYESDANAYVQGSTDELIPALCLRADILGKIREFNASLPAKKKVTVHLVDVDSPLSSIYRHLAELYTQLGSAGSSIPFPNEDEFSRLYTDKMYKLIDELRAAAADKPDVLHGLDMVSLSLDWFKLGNRLDTGRTLGARQIFAPIREDVITQNIQQVVSRLNGKPVLVFFGTAHGMKSQADPHPPKGDFKAWAQRLGEAGIDVYSLTMSGLSGNGYWHLESFSYEGPTGYRFKDGTSLDSLFDVRPAGIIYADLRTEDNANIKLPTGYLDVPASQVYDGLIIFKEFTPMENACPVENK